MQLFSEQCTYSAIASPAAHAAFGVMLFDVHMATPHAAL